MYNILQNYIYHDTNDDVFLLSRNYVCVCVRARVVCDYNIVTIDHQIVECQADLNEPLLLLLPFVERLGRRRVISGYWSSKAPAWHCLSVSAWIRILAIKSDHSRLQSVSTCVSRLD